VYVSHRNGKVGVIKIFGHFRFYLISVFILKRVHQICKFVTSYFLGYSLVTSCRDVCVSLEFIPVKYKLCSTNIVIGYTVI